MLLARPSPASEAYNPLTSPSCALATAKPQSSTRSAHIAYAYEEDLGRLDESHDAVPEAPACVSSPHGAEGLQEGDAVAALGQGEGPEGGVLD